MEREQLQPAYAKELEKCLKLCNSWGNVFSDEAIYKNTDTDGLFPSVYVLDGNKLPFFILMECKLESFRNKDKKTGEVVSSILSKVAGSALLQCAGYLQDLRANPKTIDYIPKVILCGSKTDCFTISVSLLEKYMSKVWNCPNSEIGRTYPQDLLEIRTDTDILNELFIQDINDDTFSLLDLTQGMLKMAKTSKLSLELSESNISRAFDTFKRFVLKPNKSNPDDVLNDVRFQKNLFMELISNPDECVPTNSGKAFFGEKYGLKNVHHHHFIAFKASYSFNLESKDLDRFREICDRLIEDGERRSNGDFYTPVIWSDEANNLISEQFGDTWRNDYVVWDCCCGTKNLTRDFRYENLYSSTLDIGDIEISMDYNDENVAFDYNFLDDTDVDILNQLKLEKDRGNVVDFSILKSLNLYKKAPSLVDSLLKRKPVIFFMNPPYSAPGDSSMTGYLKSVAVSNRVHKYMYDAKLSDACKQLYAQFIYQIGIIKDVFDLSQCHICMFSPVGIQCIPSLEPMRKFMGLRWLLSYGMIFNGADFDGVSTRMPIMFSIWRSDKDSRVLQNFDVDIKEISKLADVFKISKIGVKSLYNLDSMFDVVSMDKYDIDKKDKFSSELIPYVTASSEFSPKGIKNVPKNIIGSYIHKENTVGASDKDVYLMSAVCNRGGARRTDIIPDNFYDVCVDFTVRRCIPYTWKSNKDSYINGIRTGALYEQFKVDSVIYSLFNSQSKFSSLRNVYIDGDSTCYNLYNQFFYLLREDVRKVVDNKEVEIVRSVRDDLHVHGKEERYVALKINELKSGGKFSDIALKVFEKARELTLKAYCGKYRELVASDNSSFCLEAWDASWKQVCKVLSIYFKDDLDAFNNLYSEFEKCLADRVYDLGFLKK